MSESKHIKVKNFNSLNNFLKAVVIDRQQIDEPLNESEMLNESQATLREAMTAVESHSDKYKIYRDKDEIVEFKIGVKGASLAQGTARLILEAEPWNVVFQGKIYTDGRCVVPIKKMTLYPEGTIGKITFEVIIDGSVFIPWEETFVVEGHKKVNVELVKAKPDDSK